GYAALLGIVGAQAGAKVIAQQVLRIIIVEQAAVVVLGNAPLPAEMGMLYQPLVARLTVTLIRFGVVYPVVHGAEQAVGLVLYVTAFCILAVYQYLFARMVVIVFYEP